MSAVLPGGDIRPTPLADALSERYLSYALSTIMARSLPDVRDGLKPVHRRLLFAMSELGLSPTATAKKCARVVGDVIGKFPNLLANGAQGIAVGMATSIPPHNAAELCDALLHLIKHPNASFETLTAKVTGPDFPTGGILVEPASSILEAYKTGRGSFRL